MWKKEEVSRKLIRIIDQNRKETKNEKNGWKLLQIRWEVNHETALQFFTGRAMIVAKARLFHDKIIVQRRKRKGIYDKL